MADSKEMILNVNRSSIRGRACPVCGGKVIPSERAIYESKASPSDVLPIWQCEKCGYEQLSEKPQAEKKH